VRLLKVTEPAKGTQRVLKWNSSKMPLFTLTASFPSKTLQKLLQKLMCLSALMEAKERPFCFVLKKPVKSSEGTFNV